MSYETGTPSSVEDLVSKLFTFATGTPGWTQVDLDLANNHGTLLKKAPATPGWTSSPQPDLIVSFGWGIGSDAYLRICGATALGSPVTDPNTFVGRENSTLINSTTVSGTAGGKLVQFLGSGPYEAYWFFEDDNYIHVVVEISAGLFRHFSFGQALLYGEIGGTGLYTSGYFWDQGSTAIDVPTSTQHAVPFDSATSGAPGTWRCNTAVHMEHPSLSPVRSPLTQWWLDNRVSAVYTSTDGDGRLLSQIYVNGSRGGWHSTLPALIAASTATGFKPLFPMQFMARDTNAAPDLYQLAGVFPDVRYINMKGILPKQELTIGGQTWTAFPMNRNTIPPTSDNTEQCYNWGYAYKKVTT